MPDIFKLQGTVDIDAGKAEASLKRVDSSARGTQSALNRISGRKVGAEIASGFDRGAQSASRLSSVVSSLQAKINSMRGASLKFGSSGGAGGGGGIGAIAGGNLLSGAISAATGGLTDKLKQGWSAGIEYNKMLEKANISFTTLLGSSGKAADHLAKLQAFGEATPFEFPDLIKASQRMQAMGFDAQSIIPTLKNVGDAVSAVGGGKEELDGVVTALGQMKTKGKISSEEMNQLAERGIPAWDLLAKAIGKTKQETIELAGQGRIGGGAAEGIVAMMGERFGGQMDKMSATLEGRESNFNDILQKQLGQATQGNFAQLKVAYEKATIGLGTTGAQAFIAELNKMLTDVGSLAGPTLEGLASGKYFTGGAQAITKGYEAKSEYDKGNYGSAAKAAYQGAEVLSQQTTGKPILDWQNMGTTGEGALGKLTGGKAITLGGLAEKMGLIGKSAGESFSAGVAGSQAEAGKAGVAIGAAAETGVRNKLDQHSPSQVMLDLGFGAGVSFATGFENGKKAIKPITAEDLYRKQYERADKAGYDDAFKKAAQKTGLPQELLMGIGSRETNMRNIIGDGGRGAGLMQVDIGTDAAFKASGAWKDAEASIIRGAEILKEKFDWLTENAGKTVSVKGNKFTVPKLEGEEKMRTAVAMYNSGVWAPYHVSKGRSPDYGTTGKDYSADVLKRTDYFKELLGSATETKPAVDSLSSALDTAKQKFLEFTAGVISATGLTATKATPATAPKPVPVVLPEPPKTRPKIGGVTYGNDGAQAKPFTGQIGVGSVGSAEIKSGPEKITLSKDAETAGKSLAGLSVSAAQVAKPATEATKAIGDNATQAGKWASEIKAASDKTGEATKELTAHFERFWDGLSNGIDNFIESGFSKDSLKNMGKSLLKDLSSGLISQATGGKANSIGSLVSGALTGKLGGGAGNLAASLPGGFAGGANPASGAMSAATGGTGGGVGSIASKASDLLSGGKGIGGALSKLPGAAKVGGFLKGLPGVGGIFGKLGGLFGMGGAGAAGGAAGAAGAAGGIMGKISGALGFAGPWGMIAGIGLQLAAPLLGKLFGGDPFKDYKKFIQSEYGVKVDSKSVLSKVQQAGQSKFGAEWQKRKIETVKLPEVRDMIHEYAAAKGLKGGAKLFSGAEVSDQYSAMNQIKVGMRAMGGPVSAGGAYIVGERRPELFIPTTSGRVVPNTDALQGGGGGPWGRMLAMMEQMEEVMGRVGGSLDRFQSMPADQVIMTGARSNPDIITEAVDRSLGGRSDAAVRMREKLQYR